MANITRELTQEDVEELDLPWSCHTEWMNGNDHRWSYGKSGVFTLDGDDWLIEWQRGASEMQQDSGVYPWEWYGDDTITATKVVRIPVVKKRWLPVDV